MGGGRFLISSNASQIALTYLRITRLCRYEILHPFLKLGIYCEGAVFCKAFGNKKKKRETFVSRFF